MEIEWNKWSMIFIFHSKFQHQRVHRGLEDESKLGNSRVTFLLTAVKKMITATKWNKKHIIASESHAITQTLTHGNQIGLPFNFFFSFRYTFFSSYVLALFDFCSSFFSFVVISFSRSYFALCLMIANIRCNQNVHALVVFFPCLFISCSMISFHFILFIRTIV